MRLTLIQLSKIRYLGLDGCDCQKEKHIMNDSGIYVRMTDSLKGKGEGNHLQKQSMNDIYLWRTIQARQTYSLLSVDKIKKLGDGGAEEISILIIVNQLTQCLRES